MPDTHPHTANPGYPGYSLRHSLLWRAGLLIAATLLPSLLIIQLVIVQPTLDRLSERAMLMASSAASTHLNPEFRKVYSELLVHQALGRENPLSVRNLTHFNARFETRISLSPTVTSAILAREDGHEMMLLQLPDGGWKNRITDPTRPGYVHLITRNADGRTIKDVWERSTYNPLKRPWYLGAMALNGRSGVHWTEPYTFFTTGETGITASTRWRASDGFYYVLAQDIKLQDLTLLSEALQVSPNGRDFLLTEQGEVLNPPTEQNSAQATAQAADTGFFARQQNALHLGLIQWEKGGRTRDVLRFSDKSKDWLATYSPLTIGDLRLIVATVAPEADFAQNRFLSLLLVLGLALCGILGGVWAATRLAERVSTPLEQLAAESERIGALDFNPGPPVQSKWQEINRLATALGRMRELLKDANTSLEDSNRELEHRVYLRTQALEVANRELSAFSYSVSHDLRAPLRAINGFTSLLESEHSEHLNSEARDYLARVRAASMRMDGLIDSLLNLARLTGKTVRREHISFTMLANSVFEEQHEANPLRKVQYKVEEGMDIVADPDLVHDVLSNLIENAWKYTRDSNEPLVQIGKVPDTSPSVFFVRDNGMGFSTEAAGKLFMPFQRLHADSTISGTGIGLATVQRIINRHGGKIWAESEVGQGATFYFTFEPETQPETKTASPPESSAAAEPKPIAKSKSKKAKPATSPEES